MIDIGFKNINKVYKQNCYLLSLYICFTNKIMTFSPGQAPVVPFLPTIAKQLGFSTVVVGIIYTILPFIALLMKPLSGIVSDKYLSSR